jgi:hypothetical protein
VRFTLGSGRRCLRYNLVGAGTPLRLPAFMWTHPMTDCSIQESRDAQAVPDLQAGGVSVGWMPIWGLCNLDPPARSTSHRSTNTVTLLPTVLYSTSIRPARATARRVCRHCSQLTILFASEWKTVISKSSEELFSSCSSESPLIRTPTIQLTGSLASLRNP